MRAYQDVEPNEQVVESGIRQPFSVHYPASWSDSPEDLIQLSKEQPPEPIIEGLLNVGSTLLLHGNEANFKSFFVLQIAESLSMGTPLLRRWSVPKSWKVGIVDTEMNQASLGKRLERMFPAGDRPKQMLFLNTEMVNRWRKQDMDGKFATLDSWVRHSGVEVLIMDTINDFFRGNANPSDERAVGSFFDSMRTIPALARILVRHDRKKKEHDGGTDSNQLIRGSSRFKEDPETIVHLDRKDPRTNRVRFEAGKVRYDSKPEPQDLWFDAECFRLTPLPPVIAVLEGGIKTREEIISACQTRFGLEQRTVDDLIDQVRDVLLSGQQGHKRTLQIDPEWVINAPWSNLLEFPKGPSATNEVELLQPEPERRGMSGSSGPIRR